MSLQYVVILMVDFTIIVDYSGYNVIVKMVSRLYQLQWLPVVPHKAVAEVSKIGNL